MTQTGSTQPSASAPERLVYLMYHELELPGRALCQSEPGYVRYIVHQTDFLGHIRHLTSKGWRGMSVEQALSSSGSSASSSIVTPGVVFTFDDGCETDLIAAAPLLKEAGFGATFYITTGFLGSRGYLAPTQVRELSDLGFDIGCHSSTHPYLSDLATEALPAEIAVPKERLEQMIGREVAHFSCPGGRFDTRVVHTAREAGYRSLATSQPRVNTSQTNLFELGRVAVMRGTNIQQFWPICQGQGLWRMRWRNQFRASVKTFLGNSFYDRVRARLLSQ